MKPSEVNCVLFAILALGAFSGCQPDIIAQPAPGQAAGQPAAANAAPQQPVEKVTAARPSRKALQLFSMQPARLSAIDSTPLHSKLPGYVKTVHADLGDNVQQGQVLVTLGVPEMEVELAQKQALVDQAQAETEQAEAALAAAEAAVATAKALVRQAEAGIGRAAGDVLRWQLEFARLDQLAASGSVNKQLVDETKQKLAAAQASQAEAVAAVDSAQAGAAEAQAGVEKAKSDIATANARQRVAAANLQFAQTMLAYAEIKAPYDGVVTRRTVDPGHFVLPAGAETAPLMMVERTDVIRVHVAIPELEAGLVKVGAPVGLQIQSLPGGEVTGIVSRTALSLDESSRSLDVVVDLNNQDGRLRPGMYATAKVQLADRPEALVLPAAAVVRRDNTAHCFVVRDGKAVKQPIELGIKVGDEWEIAGGLSGQEIVCLTKAATLSDGQPLDALPPEEKK